MRVWVGISQFMESTIYAFMLSGVLSFVWNARISVRLTESLSLQVPQLLGLLCSGFMALGGKAKSFLDYRLQEAMWELLGGYTTLDYGTAETPHHILNPRIR